MRNLVGRRPLTFEQMEQRLALSAVPASFYLAELYGWNTLQGGFYQFDRGYTGALDGAGQSTGNNFNLIDIRDGDIVFSGPSEDFHSEDDQEGGAGSLVTPIAQPQLGNGELAEGMIAVVEIFRPTKPTQLAQSEQHVVRSEPVETSVATVADDSWKAISLSRGRDMYFEVAALSDDHQSGEQTTPRLADEIVPLVYQQKLLQREAERTSSTTSQDQAKQSEEQPPLPTTPQRTPGPAMSINQRRRLMMQRSKNRSVRPKTAISRRPTNTRTPSRSA